MTLSSKKEVSKVSFALLHFRGMQTNSAHIPEVGRGSAGTTYLAKYHRQDVAVKVASTSEWGTRGGPPS